MQSEPSATYSRFLSIITRYGRMYLDSELQPFGIRSGQIPILRFLEVRDWVSQETIRKYFHLDKGTIAKAIKPLIKEGYIDREKDPDDKRAYKIFLTEKGRKLLPSISESVKKWGDLLTVDFKQEEKEMAHNLLSRMSDNARNNLRIYRSRKGKNG